MSTTNLPVLNGNYSGNDYSGANAAPVIPQQIPMAPNPQAGPVGQPTPAQPAPAAPDVHPVDRLADLFVSHLISRMPPPPPPQNPGGFASKLAGALGNAGVALGDAAHASDRPGGWLSGIENTLSARHARLAGEQQTQFEQQERKRNDDVNIAQANANLAAHARNMQMQDEQIRHAGAADGAAFINTLRDNFKVTDDLSQSQLNEMVKKDPTYLQTHTARITGYEPVYGADGKPQLDANGLPVESPKWSIVNLAPGDISKQYTVTPEISKKWKSAGVGDIPAGTKIPASVANTYDMKALRFSTTLGLLNRDRVDALPAEVKDQIAATLQDPEVQHAIASKPGSSLDGLYTAKKNLDGHVAVAQQQLVAAQKSGDQQKIAAAQQQLDKLKSVDENLGNAINVGFTDKERADYAKQKDADAKEAEKERHEREEENLQNRRLDIQAQKETEQKGLGDSYKVQNKEFDNIRKPLETQITSIGNLQDLLNDNSAQADALIAPALLKALVAGGGVRVTQAEISLVLHGRATAEDIKAAAAKVASGKSVTDEQRAQIRAIAGVVAKKIALTNQALAEGQEALDNASTIAEQRAAVRATRAKTDAIAAGIYGPQPNQNQGGNNNTPKQNPQGQTIGHKVGDTIVQNGRTFTVTSVDQNGKVTGAQ